MKIEGLDRLRAKMAKLRERYGKEPRVTTVVGFTQRYALTVHEDLEAHHPVGQAKYLEEPARQLSNSGELGQTVEKGVKAGLTLQQSLAVGGLRLQREAQDPYTPVDTSALKASGFTCQESELEQVSAEAFAKSEAIRLAELAARGGKK